MVAEVPSTRLRNKTVVIARSVYNCTGILNNFITPLQMSPEGWNWGAKSGLFWGGVVLVFLVWTFFRLPECRGRTYGELDVLFEQKVSARRFARTAADQYTTRRKEEERGGSASEASTSTEVKSKKGRPMSVDHMEDAEERQVP